MKLYLKQWAVESESNPRDYTVSLVNNCDHTFPADCTPSICHTYECSCIGWTRHTPRRDCKHIMWVRNGGGREIDPCVMAMLKAQRKAKVAA